MSIARGSFSGTSTAVRDFVRIATFSARSAVLPSAVDVGLLPAAVWAGVDGDTEMPAAPATKAMTARSRFKRCNILLPSFGFVGFAAVSNGRRRPVLAAADVPVLRRTYLDAHALPQ